MVLKTIDIGFANLNIEIITPDESGEEFADVVVGLTDKKTGDYLQDITVVRKNEVRDAVNVYVYSDETTENYTHEFIINPYKEV